MGVERKENGLEKSRICQRFKWWVKYPRGRNHVRCWRTIEIRTPVPDPFLFPYRHATKRKMTLHPEVLWAQRSSETEAEKVADSSSHGSSSFPISDFSVDVVECRVSDGQLA